MRKSAIEKLQIVKEATSKKKIKKLSIMHGITVKTIRNWISQASEGRFVLKGRKKYNITGEGLADRKRPFTDMIYKVVKLDLPKKDCKCKELYRHIFRDRNRGLLFCSYSSKINTAVAGEICSDLISQAAKAGYTVKKIITDKIPETETLGVILKDHGTSIVRENFLSIRKHSLFSQKKNSYVKVRTKYEKCSDFIFDSLATVCRNNDITAGKMKRGRNILDTVKKINGYLHSSAMNNVMLETTENDILQILLSNYGKALEFQKKFDLDNADHIYEKLYYILKDSSAAKDLLINVMIRRAKLSGLKKSYDEADSFIAQSMRLLKDATVKNRYFLMYNLYMEVADMSRTQNNKIKTLYYMDRSGKLLDKINDPVTTAVFYLNYGKVQSDYRMHKRALENFEKGRAVVEENNLTKLKSAVEESFASAYSISGRYEESKKIFEKMINEDFYADSPYFRALLYAKYADLFHLTGDLLKSVKYYDISLDLISKHPEINVFVQLELIIGSNKAFSLLKMNEFCKARSIFERNLKIAQDKNFPDLVSANIAYIIICLNEQRRMNESEKYLKDLKLLLRNNNNPEMEYKYYQGMGEVYMNKRDFVKSEESMQKAVSISESPSLPSTSYFYASLKLADLYAVSGEGDKAKKITNIIIKRAKKNNFKIFLFKGVLFKKKAECFLKNKIIDYIEHLNKIKTKEANDEIKYFIEREIARHSNN